MTSTFLLWSVGGDDRADGSGVNRSVDATGTVRRMCCFSGVVREVSRTRIFARATDGGRQVLAYSMTVAADHEVAMILPLPTPAGVAEDDLRFIDLSGYPELFTAIDAAFPAYLSAALAPASLTRMYQPQALVVHEVGDFVASFVPSVHDFDRLDQRFRLPDAVWDQRAEYLEASFAVFQLKSRPTEPAPKSPTVFDRIVKRSGGADRDDHGVRGTIHPMAFEFPRRDPGRLFFPTVHVHDGSMAETASFDHQLYWQGGPLTAPHEESELAQATSADIGAAVDIERTMGLVDPGLGCRRWDVAGDRPNVDTYVDAYVDDPRTIGAA